METALYGHTSQESSYLVSDYPYGRNRCQIRFWLESDPKKGFRFVSQTEDPKRLIWNAPKKSTYMLLAGNMYLDEKGHCHWAGLSQYSDAKEVLAFIRRFPGMHPFALSSLRSWCLQKTIYCKGLAEGKIGFKINGIIQPKSEDELAEYREEVKGWEECSLLLKGVG